VSSKAKAEAVVYGLDKLGELLGGTKAERLARAADKGVDYARMGERTGGNVPGAGILDTSLAARMRRAEEQWYNPSQRWYHGTAETDEYGDPITSFISSSDKFDTNFMSDMGSWFTDSPDVANHFADKNFSGAQPQVYPVYLRQKNPARFDTYEDLEDAFAEFDGSAPEFAQHLKAQGHDGIIVENSDTDISLLRRDAVMFDSRDARSVNANFDPAKADSSDLLAGIANVAAPLLKTAVGTGAAYTAAGALAPQEAEAGPIKILSHIDDAGKAVYKTVIDAWHGGPHTFPAERLVRMPDGSQQHLVGGVDALPDVPAGAELVQDFPLGRFRMDKIGTGEGAQAYGHGLYQADAKETGIDYRNALVERARVKHVVENTEDRSGFFINGEFKSVKDFENAYSGYEVNTLKEISENGVEATLKKARERVDELPLDNPMRAVRERVYNKIKKFANQFDGETVQFVQDIYSPDFELKGSLYRTQIDVDPDTLLDWDKPLSEQPQQAQKAIADYTAMAMRDGSLSGQAIFEALPENPTYKEWHHAVSRLIGTEHNQAPLSEQFKNAGIPGIRYLDGVSRTNTPPSVVQDGDKFAVYWGNDPRPVDRFNTIEEAQKAAQELDTRSYNYVIFDDKPINIVERGNANPLLLGGAALATGGAMALGAQDAEASFIGQAAKTWPAVMEAFARKMKHEGVSRKEIWQKTGIDLDNVDGLPRSEIDDSGSLFSAPTYHDFYAQSLDRMGYRVGQSGTPEWVTSVAAQEAEQRLNKTLLRDGLSHEALYQAYPSNQFGQGLPNTNLKTGVVSDDFNGAYNSKTKTIEIAEPRINDLVDPRSTPMHETAHVIQDIEGFAKGGSPQSVASEKAKSVARLNFLNTEQGKIARRMDEITHSYNKPRAGFEDEYTNLRNEYDAIMSEKMSLPFTMDDPTEAYYRLAGEAEARNVQARLNMTAAERRATPPWETVDVPESEQIVRMRGNTTPLTLAATAAGTGAGMAAYGSDSPNYEMPAYDGIDLSGSNLMQDPQYIDQINAYVRDAFEAQTAADQFTQMRSSKQGYWEARRQELLDMVDSLGELAVESSPTLVGAMGMIGMNKDRLMTDADMPLRSLLAGGGAIIDAAQGRNLQTIGNNAQQIIQSPSEDTTYGVGGTITDALSPYIPDEAAAAAGALVHGGLQIGTL
jgi:hypothetical protein